MENGRVTSFDADKGSGWIVPALGYKEIFVHKRNILGRDVTTLPVDAMVTYESRTNAKGLEAFNVSIAR